MSGHLPAHPCLPDTDVTDFCSSKGAEGRFEGERPGQDNGASATDMVTFQSPSDPPCTKKGPSKPAQDKAFKGRTTYSRMELEVLHQRFRQQKYLSPMQIHDLASSLNLGYKQVKTWFQNRRMKFKKKQGKVYWTGCNWVMQENSEPVMYSKMPPGVPPGYTMHAGGNVMGPMGDPHQNYRSLVNPCIPEPVNRHMGWYALGILDTQTLPVMEKPESTIGQGDFFPDCMAVQGVQQEGSYGFPPPCHFPGPDGLVYNPYHPQTYEHQLERLPSDCEDTENLL